jgi:hypothetical protein
MALTPKQTELLTIFFTEKSSRGLLTFFLLTKQEQKDEMVVWLQARKVANTTTISNLNANLVATQTALTNENTLIDQTILLV